MKIVAGVEWAAHACLVLAALPPGEELAAEALAAFHELPPAYLAKHMQALARAGVVCSSRGARGGYRLARDPAAITLWDIVSAIEGPGPGFRCQEIRGRGPCASTDLAKGRMCDIAAAFHEAEGAYRERLRAVSIADIALALAGRMDAEAMAAFGTWLAGAR